MAQTNVASMDDKSRRTPARLSSNKCDNPAMRIRVGALVLFAVLLLPAQSSAQTCAGYGPIQAGNWQFTAGPGWTSNATRGLVFLQRAIGDAFVAGGYGLTKIDDPPNHSQLFFGAAGYQFAESRDPRIALCVGVEAGYFTGPNVAPIDVSGTSLEGTATLGLVVIKTDAFSLIPTVGLSALRNNTTVSSGALSASNSDTTGRFRLGMGFVFARHVAFVPSFDLPTNGDNSKEFAVLLGITF